MDSEKRYRPGGPVAIMMRKNAPKSIKRTARLKKGRRKFKYKKDTALKSLTPVFGEIEKKQGASDGGDRRPVGKIKMTTGKVDVAEGRKRGVSGLKTNANHVQ